MDGKSSKNHLENQLIKEWEKLLVSIRVCGEFTELGMKRSVIPEKINKRKTIMSTQQLSESLVDDFVARFAQLGMNDQIIILNRLKESTKVNDATLKNFPEKIFLPKPPNAPSFEELAGSWEDDRSAEEIIEDLRRSRTPNLDRVNFD